MVAHVNLVLMVFFNVLAHQNLKVNVVNFVSIFPWTEIDLFLLIDSISDVFR